MVLVKQEENKIHEGVSYNVKRENAGLLGVNFRHNSEGGK